MKINLQHRSDEQLAADLRNGDLQAMEELYVRYFKMVYYRCFTISKNKEDASDFAQDIMLKVFDRIASFRMESRFSSWVYSIASNYCIDTYRKDKIRLSYVQSNPERMPEQVEPPYDPNQRDQTMHEALEAIELDDRTLLEQKYLLNMSIRDLEVTYQLSTSAIKMRLKRARQRMADKVNSALEH